MYTIKCNGATKEKAEKIRLALIEKLAKNKTFNANVNPVQFFYKGSREGSRQEGWGFTIKTVRLQKAKPYCGQHPGECQVIFGKPNKKPVMKYLEWEDWVKFHTFVNSLLNQKCSNADVWSNPPDVRGIMWIRRGKKPRKTYSWDEDFNGFRIIRKWNRGEKDDEY